MNFLAKLRQFSRDRLPLILGIYIVIQPLLDVLTAFGAKVKLPITAGVVVRSLFMLLCLLYVVFVSHFPGKKLCLAVLGVLIGYLVLFMAYMLSLGGISLCLRNLQDVAKTFFTPFVAVFLYTIYREYGHQISVRAVAWSGALYCSVILLAAITGTSFTSYGNSGYGLNGWFYAANETGCIIALTAPVTIYYCTQQMSTVTKKTWWRGAAIAWTLVAIACSANFIGTKVVFGFTLIYSAAALIWWAVRLCRERTRLNAARCLVMLLMVALIIWIYFYSPLRSYLKNIFDKYKDVPSDVISTYWPSDIQAQTEGTWLQKLIADNAFVQRIDQILSRRLYTAASSVEVFLNGGFLTKLLGVGYANAPGYGRSVAKMIEMDPAAILIRHGILGFVVYILPYLAFIVHSVIQFFKHPLKRLNSLKYCTYLYATLAAFAIATITGHALVSPAVSTFLLAVSFGLWTTNREQNAELQKE